MDMVTCPVDLVEAASHESELAWLPAARVCSHMVWTKWLPITPPACRVSGKPTGQMHYSMHAFIAFLCRWTYGCGTLQAHASHA